MTRGEEDLPNVFFKHLLMIAFVLIHFVSCVNQFPVSVSCHFIFSVSLGLRKIQLLELAYRQDNGTLRQMQDEDRVEFDGLSDSKMADFITIIIIYFFDYLFFIFFIHLFFYDLFIYSRHSGC